MINFKLERVKFCSVILISSKDAVVPPRNITAYTTLTSSIVMRATVGGNKTYQMIRDSANLWILNTEWETYTLQFKLSDCFCFRPMKIYSPIRIAMRETMSGGGRHEQRWLNENSGWGVGRKAGRIPYSAYRWRALFTSKKRRGGRSAISPSNKTLSDLILINFCIYLAATSVLLFERNFLHRQKPISARMITSAASCEPCIDQL